MYDPIRLTPLALIAASLAVLSPNGAGQCTTLLEQDVGYITFLGGGTRVLGRVDNPGHPDAQDLSDTFFVDGVFPAWSVRLVPHDPKLEGLAHLTILENNTVLDECISPMQGEHCDIVTIDEFHFGVVSIDVEVEPLPGANDWLQFPYELLVEPYPQFGCSCSPDHARTYCTSLPNAYGVVGTLAGSGSLRWSDNDLSLVAEDCIIGSPGVFFFGPEVANVPFGDGVLCVGAPQHRLWPIVPVDGAGAAVRSLDFSAGPLSGMGFPGATLYFQYWYRDPFAMGSGWNLTDALAIQFCP